MFPLPSLNSQCITESRMVSGVFTNLPLICKFANTSPALLADPTFSGARPTNGNVARLNNNPPPDFRPASRLIDCVTVPFTPKTTSSARKDMNRACICFARNGVKRETNSRLHSSPPGLPNLTAGYATVVSYSSFCRVTAKCRTEPPARCTKICSRGARKNARSAPSPSKGEPAPSVVRTALQVE